MVGQVLKKELSKYRLPRYRIMNLNKNNLIWLLKNIGKENSDKENFGEVCASLKNMVENKKFKN